MKSHVPARVRTVAVRTLLVLALAMAGTALSARPHAAAAAAPTLMIYGDSITQGASGDYTWRYQLWKNLTADGAKAFGLIDDIVPEPLGGAHRDWEAAAANLRAALRRHLNTLADVPADLLVADRYEKFRSMGRWLEVEPDPAGEEAA